jgi:hypothetical protein
MSKTSRRNKAERRLASKMGNYTSMQSKSSARQNGFNKPGSKQIKG